MHASDGAKPKRISGPDIIRDHVTRLPGKPGVYRMFGETGELLYVGKARNLKARVSNYAKIGGQTQRIARMISLTRSMEFVVTASETEALLLEANLIKRLKPRFNIILRDDKSFPHILIREDHEAPQALKHRGAKRIKGQYFGPFASAGAVDQTLDTLQKAFLLRTCTDNIYATRSRPCMLHQMGRCSAPCVGLIPLDEYRDLVREAERFLNGDAETLQQQLVAQMERAAANTDYERAAALRDRIRALSSVRQSQSVNPDNLVEADVFAIHSEAGQSAVQAFFFRAGQNWGATVWYPKHDRDDTPEQVLTAFIAQFYDDKPVPKLILLNTEIEEPELMTDALELKAEHKVEIRTPQRGEKRGIVEQAQLNAREALGRKLADTQSQAKIFAAVQKVFDLPEPPKRIEVYDNSHIMGTNMVGGMVVAGPEGFEKNSYRKFNIKDEELEPGDDYGMMREVMRRRFARLKKEYEELNAPPPAEANTDAAVGEPLPLVGRGAGVGGGSASADASDISNVDQPPTPTPPHEGEGQPKAGVSVGGGRKPDAWPDLVLIDGGLGQLSAAREAIAALGFAPGELNLVAIAKGPDRNAGREQFFRPNRAPFQLPPNDPALYYLQRLRDEAHRWAIGAHRAKRSAAMTGQNPLDEITGVGVRRKKALLHRFGSAKGVSRATVADLQTVEGVNEALAKRIYDFFHNG
ncbi:MAG TPA: excinuclease ABC subunit UvrC [Hyphomonadaceae bacterium]|nr:excinuclease ABC subunit UvrC [Hyphomonadaceae bacterium]HPN06139.1 excinuclease ABC subunit UvrC [Hyphomonadaceae bacterium]